MPEVSALTQVVQLGVETTAGTAVAATKRLGSISIEPKIETDIKVHRPAGQKFSTLAVQNKEWTSAKITGVPTFHEMLYLLSSLIDAATITTPGGGTTTRLWTFEPDSTDADAPKTFTIECGNSVAARRFAHGLITGLSLDWSRDEVSIGGDMIGTKLASNALSGSTTMLPLIPVSPNYVSVYLDTTAAGLGTTKLTRNVKGSIGLTDRYGAIWSVDAAVPSFAATVEKEPGASVSLTVAADTVADSILTRMRAGDTAFLRWEAVGPTIEAALTYKLTFDIAIKCSAVNEFSDEDGLYALGFEFAIVHDGTWGKAMQVAVAAPVTAL